MSAQQSRFRKILGKTWRVFDVSMRTVIYVVVLIGIFALLGVAMKDDTPEVPKKAALVVNPDGVLVEQLTATDPLTQLRNEVQNRQVQETLAKDVFDAIKAAKDDDRIAVLYFNLTDFSGAGLSKLQEWGDVIDDFKQSGKKVIAYADSYTQAGYYVAAHADEILVHHMGMVILEGFGRYRQYYREGLDKYGITVNIFRVGKFKSAVEPYLRDSMSDEAKEANLAWMGDLWDDYLTDVAAARGVDREVLLDYANDFGTHVDRVKGDTAQAALDAKLVDAIVSRDEKKQKLIALVGEDEDSHSFHNVVFSNYLKTLKDDRFGDSADGDAIAVIVARGTILNGTQPPGTIGGDSTAALIRDARQDEKTKAIVFRVDSGGGSAFASEVIRKELELAQGQGLPVVVSMGSVAASGGYWVSTSCDELWASPTTITGSIGIFGMFPSFEKTLANYAGIHVDGVGTTPFSDAVRPDRAMPEAVQQTIQQVIEEGYEDFLERVANARGMTRDQVDGIAQGRVWSGKKAHELGLIDKLGDLADAIDSAAAMAKLTDYDVKYMRKKPSFFQSLVADFMSSHIDLPVGKPSVFSQTVGELEQGLREFDRFNDPNGIYAYSYIETD